MTTKTKGMTIYILAKNEEANIGRCLESLRTFQGEVIVLDTGCTDSTRAVVAGYPFARVETFTYESHVQAYNELTTRHSPQEGVVVLDADMRFPAATLEELEAFGAGANQEFDVLQFPVDMWWAGVPLPHGSLYPPKSLAFRGGRSYFRAVGHGETLVEGVKFHLARHAIIHDDRKRLEVVLANQCRYARDLVARLRRGEAHWRDTLRTRTPLLMVGVPLVTLVARGGFRSGRAGFIYALDRLIAEAIFLRAGLVDRLEVPPTEASVPSGAQKSRPSASVSHLTA